MIARTENESYIVREYNSISDEGKRLIFYLMGKEHGRKIKYAIKNGLGYTVLLDLEQLGIDIEKVDLVMDDNIGLIQNGRLVLTKLVASIRRAERKLTDSGDFYDVEVTIGCRALVFVQKVKVAIQNRIDGMVRSN